MCGPIYIAYRDQDVNPSIQWGGVHEIPPLSEELLGEGKTVFFGNVDPEAINAIVDGPTPIYIQAALDGQDG